MNAEAVTGHWSNIKDTFRGVTATFIMYRLASFMYMPFALSHVLQIDMKGLC